MKALTPGLPAVTSVRRAPNLVAYWRAGTLVIENFAAGKRVSTLPLAAEILDHCTEWQTIQQVADHFPGYPRSLVRRVVDGLLRHTLLERSDRRTPGSRDLALWEPWNPAAGFFHFGTRNLGYVKDAVTADRALRRQARRWPMPSATKSYVRGARLPDGIPVPQPLDAVLTTRRTWRRFGAHPIELNQLATLLRMTWGVQYWVDIAGQGRIALKTSPSGGAQHPGEVYVVALNVRAVKPGVYHYDAGRHRLTRLKQPRAALAVERYLPHQSWYRRAGALMIMSAVVEREMWKYRSPRAYRAMLIDAGHLCQTFCLVATALGLAPFCSMALAEDRIEQDLGLDGVSETVLYCAGVGSRSPKGSSS